jgi:site-specific DNA recombinase
LEIHFQRGVERELKGLVLLFTHWAKAFELMATGNDTPSRVLKTMTAMGLRSKKGKQLNLHSFLNMLRNPAYIGMVRSKKWRDTRQGLHQPIVDEPTFRNVQLILKGKKPVAAPYSMNRPEFPLRRFLRCGECGTRLTGGPAKGENGTKYGYYWCYKCHAVKTTRTEKVHGQFFEMLKRLRPDAKFLTEFPAILKEEWGKRTGDTVAVVRRLKADLLEKRESQAKLLAKYLNDDKNIMPHFQQMNSRFEQEIAGLESQIAEVESEKATFEQLWEFSKSLLVDIATAWGKADVDQKQRVQNVLFPTGLKYHPQEGILNSNNDCLFNQLEDFVSGKMNMVRPERFELPAFWFVARWGVSFVNARFN